MDPRAEPRPENGEIKPFLDHLEDLRRMLLHCLAAVAAGMLICLPIAPRILGLLKAPLAAVVDDPERFLASIEVVGAFTVSLRIALWSGVLLSAPFLLLFIGRFVFPGLTLSEKGVVLKSLGFAVAFFAIGVWVGYGIMLPVALGAMLKCHQWLGIRAAWVVTSYAAFATQLLIGFGLAFELPIVVVVLGRLGIVNSAQLRGRRRHVVVAILIGAAMLTPPDVFSQIVMAAPLILLYEVCIWLVRLMERRAER